jgi:acyl dehydratase
MTTWKKYWEDLSEGEFLPCRDVPFGQSEIIEFGKKYDPQPFHVDEAAARASIFGGLIASALHTLSACTKAVVEAQGGELAVLGGLGLDEARMKTPVRPGDVLRIEARWTGLRTSQSRPDRGIAKLRCKVSNQRGEPVAEFGYNYLIARRNSRS